MPKQPPVLKNARAFIYLQTDIWEMLALTHKSLFILGFVTCSGRQNVRERRTCPSTCFGAFSFCTSGIQKQTAYTCSKIERLLNSGDESTLERSQAHFILNSSTNSLPLLHRSQGSVWSLGKEQGSVTQALLEGWQGKGLTSWSRLTLWFSDIVSSIINLLSSCIIWSH